MGQGHQPNKPPRIDKFLAAAQLLIGADHHDAQASTCANGICGKHLTAAASAHQAPGSSQHSQAHTSDFEQSSHACRQRSVSGLAVAATAGQTQARAGSRGSTASQDPARTALCGCCTAAFAVPGEALDKAARCIDVVTLDCHDTNCFTKAYGRYVKGTGSVLATRNLHVLDTFSDWGHREQVRPAYKTWRTRHTLAEGNIVACACTSCRKFSMLHTFRAGNPMTA